MADETPKTETEALKEKALALQEKAKSGKLETGELREVLKDIDIGKAFKDMQTIMELAPLVSQAFELIKVQQSQINGQNAVIKSLNDSFTALRQRVDAYELETRKALDEMKDKVADLQTVAINQTKRGSQKK